MRSGVPIPAYNSRSGGAGAGVSGLTTADAGDAIGNNEVIRGDGTTGIQGSTVTLTDAGALSGVTSVVASTGYSIESGNETLNLNGANADFGSAGHVRFFSDPDIGSGAADAGLNRAAAGRLKVTNGGAGYGGLDAGDVRLGGFTAGLGAAANNELYLVSNNVPVLEMYLAVSPMIRNDGQYTISSAAGVTGAEVPDVGLKRLAAGKLQGTDGSTGALTAFQLTATVGIFQGAGSPEAAVTAGIGSIYLRTDGGAATSIYVKESGTGNTGWVAK